MPKHPTQHNDKTEHGIPHTGKKSVHAGTDFTKRSVPLPKPPTTSVANHSQNLKGKRTD